MNTPNSPQRPEPPAPPSIPEQEEEVSHLDDAVIGRAFRWSTAALGLVVLLGVAAVLYFKRKPPAPPTKLTQLSAPVAPETRAATVPNVAFTDVTAAAGIKFVHNNGAAGEKLLPETMGGGVAFLDYDNDGDQDLLFVNCTYWPGKVPPGKAPTTAALYANNGSGQFKDVTAASGLNVPIYGMGVAAGDYDNDGRVDVFISAVDGSHLFHNDGNGHFTDVTAVARMAGRPGEWSTSCAWVDYDNDGDLDLFVANYVKWSRELDFEVDYKLDGVGRAYGPPMNFPGTFPYLYRNNGKGQFTDVSGPSGIERTSQTATGVPQAKSLGVAPVDLDRDGWIDLVVANDTVPNFVFHNLRNGAFEEIGALTSIAFDNYGQTRGAMGIDAGYFRDDTLGIAIGNFANEMTALYVSQKNPLLFTDDAISEGVGPASRLLLKFGIFFFDYDLDGRLDLLTANGHLEQEIGKVQQSQQYAQPAQLFWNCGPQQGATFIPVPAEKAGSALFKPIVGRGSAFGDIDGDGDLDVVLTQIAGPPLLLRNDQKLGSQWIRLKLVGTRSNRDAIGARIKVVAKGKTLLRQVMPTRSYLSQSELPVTIGLGEAVTIERVEITWPNGKVQAVTPPPPLGQTTILTEPAS